MPQQPSQRRLFFACWPDAAVRQAIIERRRLIDGVSPRRVPDHNLHLTLLFLGNQPAAQLPEMLAAVDRMDAPGFILKLDCFGWFAGARVAWLGGPAPQPAQALVERLGDAMAGLGLAFEPRRFHPHITLYRKVGRQPDFPRPPPLDWPIREFVLIESIPSRPYQVLRTWPLSLSPG
ncbi:MAG: RNA 2',3'-cyclic phosphodiesterase [Wenzhouxiangella sp.]